MLGPRSRVNCQLTLSSAGSYKPSKLDFSGLYRLYTPAGLGSGAGESDAVAALEDTGERAMEVHRLQSIRGLFRCFDLQRSCDTGVSWPDLCLSGPTSDGVDAPAAQRQASTDQEQSGNRFLKVRAESWWKAEAEVPILRLPSMCSTLTLTQSLSGAC